MSKWSSVSIPNCVCSLLFWNRSPTHIGEVKIISTSLSVRRVCRRTSWTLEHCWPTLCHENLSDKILGSEWTWRPHGRGCRIAGKNGLSVCLMQHWNVVVTVLPPFCSNWPTPPAWEIRQGLGVSLQHNINFTKNGAWNWLFRNQIASYF